MAPASFCVPKTARQESGCKIYVSCKQKCLRTVKLAGTGMRRAEKRQEPSDEKRSGQNFRGLIAVLAWGCDATQNAPPGRRHRTAPPHRMAGISRTCNAGKNLVSLYGKR